MGNQIAIPDSKEELYLTKLENCGYHIVKKLPDNSLFKRFICERTDPIKETYLIKGYINNKKDILNYTEIREKLKELKEPYGYTDIIIEEDNSKDGPISLFLVRPKIGKSLTEVVCNQEPPLYSEEKFFLTYQLFRILGELHQKKFYHGDLKPNNIIYIPNGRIFITDPAPFKPYRLDQPHLFYYFFSSDGSDDFYLSPERLLAKDSNYFYGKLPEDKEAADIYSLGCIIAFLYLDGEPLLQISTAQNLAFGKLKFPHFIKEMKSRINNEKIANIIEHLIDPVKKSRINYFKNLLPNEFPSYFKNLYDELFMKSMDTCTIDKCKNIIQTVIHELPDDNLTPEIRLILFNFFQYHCLLNTSLSTTIQFIQFLLDFTLDFDSEVKISRVFPFLIQLLRAKLLSIRHAALSAVVSTLKTIDNVNDDLKSFFCKELAHRLSLLLVSQDNANSYIQSIQSNIKIDYQRNYYLIAEFLPFIALELERLNYESFNSLLKNYFYNILGEADIDVFKVLAHSLIIASKDADYNYFYTIRIFLKNIMNKKKNANSYYDIHFLNEYIEVLNEFFKNAKDNEKNFYIQSLLGILPNIFDEIAINNLIAFKIRDLNIKLKKQNNEYVIPDLPEGWNQNEQSPYYYEEFACRFLEFLILLLERHFLHNSLTGAIATIIKPLQKLGSVKVKILIEKISKFNTPLANQLSLLSFVNTFADQGDTRNQNQCKPICNNREVSPFGGTTIHFQSLLKSSDISEVKPTFLNSKRFSREKVTNVNISSKNVIVCVINNHDLSYRLKESFYKDTNSEIIGTHFLNSSQIIISTKNGAIKSLDYTGNQISKYRDQQETNSFVNSFCSINDNCIATGHFNGQIDIVDAREKSISSCLSFNLNTLQTLSRCNDDIIYVGWSSGLVSPIDLRMCLPISKIMTIPAFHVWPIKNPKTNESAFAVYDNHMIQFYHETDRKHGIIEIAKNKFGIISTKHITGCPYKGGIIAADDDSVTYIDVFRNNSSLRLFDEFKTSLSFDNINPNSTLSSPLTIGSEYLDGLPLSSLHMHHSTINCIAHNGPLFVTADSLGFVNSWRIE